MVGTSIVFIFALILAIDCKEIATPSCKWHPKQKMRILGTVAHEIGGKNAVNVAKERCELLGRESCKAVVCKDNRRSCQIFESIDKQVKQQTNDKSKILTTFFPDIGCFQSDDEDDSTSNSSIGFCVWKQIAKKGPHKNGQQPCKTFLRRFEGDNALETAKRECIQMGDGCGVVTCNTQSKILQCCIHEAEESELQTNNKALSYLPSDACFGDAKDLLDVLEDSYISLLKAGYTAATRQNLRNQWNKLDYNFTLLHNVTERINLYLTKQAQKYENGVCFLPIELGRIPILSEVLSIFPNCTCVARQFLWNFTVSHVTVAHVLNDLAPPPPRLANISLLGITFSNVGLLASRYLVPLGSGGEYRAQFLLRALMNVRLVEAVKLSFESVWEGWWFLLLCQCIRFFILTPDEEEEEIAIRKVGERIPDDWRLSNKQELEVYWRKVVPLLEPYAIYKLAQQKTEEKCTVASANSVHATPIKALDVDCFYKVTPALKVRGQRGVKLNIDPVKVEKHECPQCLDLKQVIVNKHVDAARKLATYRKMNVFAKAYGLLSMCFPYYVVLRILMSFKWFGLYSTALAAFYGSIFLRGFALYRKAKPKYFMMALGLLKRGSKSRAKLTYASVCEGTWHFLRGLFIVLLITGVLGAFLDPLFRTMKERLPFLTANLHLFLLKHGYLYYFDLKDHELDKADFQVMRELNRDDIVDPDYPDDSFCACCGDHFWACQWLVPRLTEAAGSLGGPIKLLSRIQEDPMSLWYVVADPRFIGVGFLVILFLSYKRFR